MCMKCFVTFERQESFRKHLFWKHGDESRPCGRCHTPPWPHVYHFCLPGTVIAVSLLAVAASLLVFAAGLLVIAASLLAIAVSLLAIAVSLLVIAVSAEILFKKVSVYCRARMTFNYRRHPFLNLSLLPSLYFRSPRAVRDV